MIMKKNKRKHANFQLDWKFNDPNALCNVKEAMTQWINKHLGTVTKDVRVRDIMIEIMPKTYESLSRGDKCRVGKAISYLFNKGNYPELERGRKKGVTNTYHIAP